MNDDFLHKQRQAPDPAFAKRLYQQLHEEDDDMSTLPMTRTYTPRARFPVGAAALFLIVLFSMIFALRPLNTPPRLAQIDTGFLDTLQPISSENAGSLTEVARLGSGSIYDVDWDGDVIAVGGALGVWVYDSTRTGTPPRLLQAENTIFRRQVALAGTLIAATDGDHIRVWDAESGEPVGAFGGEGLQFNAVAISPDGRYVAGGEARLLSYQPRYQVFVWDRETGEQVFLREFEQPILNIDFNPLRLHEFAVQNPAALYVFDVDSTIERAQFTESPRLSLNPGLDYHPNGEVLAFGTEQGVTLWDVNSETVVQTITFDEDYAPLISDVAFNGDGTLLAIASANYRVSLWDVAANAFVDPPIQDAIVSASALAFNDVLGDPTLASVQFGSEVHLTLPTLDNASFAPLRGFASPISMAALSGDDRTVAAAGLDGNIHVWDIETGEETLTLETGKEYLTTFAISPDGSTLAYGNYARRGADGTYPPATRGGVTLVDLTDPANQRRLGGENKHYSDVAFSPDGETLAAFDTINGQIETWAWREAEDGAAGTLFISPLGTSTFAYSPDQQWIGVINLDQATTLSLYDAAGVEQTLFAERLDYLTAFAFSPDGTRIAIGQRLEDGSGSRVRVYDLETGQQVAAMQYATNTDYVADLAFSPDGTLIAGVVDEGRLHVWDAATGEQLFDHSDATIINNRIMFTSDGRMIISADWDGFIRVWGIPE